METSFEALRKVQLQERHQPTLVRLEDGFYDEYLDFLAQAEARLKEQFSLDGARALENAGKSLQDVFELRKQKIVFKALKDYQTGSVNTDSLASKEKELYTGLIKLFSTTSELAKKQSPNAVDVQVLTDIPAFVGLDAKTYGPFKAGQTIQLDAKQAAFLNKKGVVQVTT